MKLPSFPDRCADQVIRLAGQTETFQQIVNAFVPLGHANERGQREPCGTVERLANGERAHQSILLLDVRGCRTWADWRAYNW